MEGPSGPDEPVLCPQLLAQSISSTIRVLVVLAGGSAFADHILRKIGDHLRRSCAGTAVHRNLLHTHAAHRFYPL